MEKADTLGEMWQRTLVLDFSTSTDKLTCLCLPLSQEESWRIFPGSSSQVFCCLRFRGFSPAVFYSPSVDPISQSASLFSLIFFSSFPPLGLYPQQATSACLSKTGQGLVAQRVKRYGPARDHVAKPKIRLPFLGTKPALNFAWPWPVGLQVGWAKTTPARALTGWAVPGESWSKTRPHNLL